MNHVWALWWLLALEGGISLSLLLILLYKGGRFLPLVIKNVTIQGKPG